MTGPTHAVAGVAAGALVALALRLPDGLLPAALAMGLVAGLLPDIDEPGSSISRRIPLLGQTVGRGLPHRRITHSAAAVAGLALLVHLALPHAPWRWVAVPLAGYASHLFCDALTPAGIALLWPLPWRLRLGGWVRTGGWAEQALFLPAFAALALWAAVRVIRAAHGGTL